MSHPDEHVLVLEPDQAARARELMLWQDTGKPRLTALVNALAAGAQFSENTIWSIIVGATTVDGAEGVSLDRWGEIVGERRGGLDHEQFAKFIGLRIRVNTEHPSEDAVGGVLTEAVEPSTVASYLVADGIVYLVASESFLPGSIAAHAGALIRDFRPAAIYAAVSEQESGGFAFGSIASPGSVWGSIASPGPVWGRLIYSGR